MTDQERNLTAAMNAQRFSEEVARQLDWDVLMYGVSFSKGDKRISPFDVQVIRQAQQRKTFGGG